MFIGIEFEKRNLDGRTFIRIAPKVQASYRIQQAIYGIGFLLALAAVIGAFSLILAHPDPMIKPDNTVVMWGGAR